MEQSYKILIVDDEEDVAEFIRSFLSLEGHRCEVALNGVKALEKITGDKFDAVITDIVMPEMDGIVLCKEVSKRYPGGIPIMVMTGFTDQHHAKKAIDAGASDFISKPFTVAEFMLRFYKMVVEHGNLVKRKEAEEQLSYLAYFDNLTGLPNRVLFFDRLGQITALSKRDSKSLALMFLDLDGFKLINDNYGHDIGDILLKEAAKRMLGCIRKSDTVARIGGDEFGVILINIDNPQSAVSVSEKIIKSLTKPFRIRGHNCSIGVSIGIGIYPEDGEDVDTLLKNADIAMYRAKTQQGSAYQFFKASW